MLRNKKKLILLCAALGVISAHAQPQLPPTQPVDDPMFRVFVPNLQPGLEIHAAATWLRPGANNLNYVIYNQELPAQSPAWNERELRPRFAPGFEVGARFVFPCAGEDVSLDWIHFNSNTSGTTNAPNEDFFLGPDYEIGPPGLVIRHARGHVRFQYDVINFSGGQFVDFGPRAEARFFGGVSAAFLREDIITNYSGNTPVPFPGPFNMKQDITANYTGIGPRVGINMAYKADYGFSFFGEAAVSALIGSSYSKANFTGSAAELLTVYGQRVNHQLIKDQNVLQVIPAIDTKLGLTYDYQFANCSIFKVSAGYQAAVYVNAISQYLPQSLVVFEGIPEGIQTGGIFVATMSHRLANFSVQGPFLNFAFLF